MKKKLFSFLLAFCLIMPAMFALTACGDDPADPHNHDYEAHIEYAIANNKAYKVKKCSCGATKNNELENYVIATTVDIAEKVSEITDGTTIVLNSGDYADITIDKDTIGDTKNITIVGVENVSVELIFIDRHSTGKIEGVTIENITFDGTTENDSGVIVGVSGVENLIVRNCNFIKNSRILGHGEQENISITNILVEGCSFDMTNMEDKDDMQLSAINIWGSNGVTIKNNTFKNIDYNAIQLAGDINGEVLIEGNIIDGTVDRALRFNNVNADVTIKNNTIRNVENSKGELLKATSVNEDGKLVFDGNTYNGNSWAPANVTTPATDVIYTTTLN